MGRSTSWGQLGRKIDELETSIGGSTRRAVQASAAVTKLAVMMNLGSTGRPITMSQLGTRAKRDEHGRVVAGTARRGRHKIGVRYDIKKSAKNYTALVRAYGNMHWLERGTQGHWIPKAAYQRSLLKRGDVSGLRRAEAKANQRITMKMTRGDGGYVTGPIWHPGSRGTRPWSRGIALARRQTEPVFAAELQKGMRRIF